MKSVSLHRVTCLLSCGHEVESTDKRFLVEELERHMWDEHRLAVDPLEIEGMVRPSYRISRRESKASRSADSHVPSRS